jgi:putative endonuclease
VENDAMAKDPPQNDIEREERRATAGDSRQLLGREGESRAAEFLEARGYRIVARNVRADRVEIDLVARRGPLLVFIEVKTRRSTRFGSAAESVDPRKQHRLRRGAGAWLASKPDAARGSKRVRFDVVTCQRDRAPSEARRASEALEKPNTFGAPNETTAPFRARWSGSWRIEHWEGAF